MSFICINRFFDFNISKTSMSGTFKLGVIQRSNKRWYNLSSHKQQVEWQNRILNSFDFPFTNGFTEGCNNKIKVLKRNAYVYRSFNRFRNRILHIFNHKKLSLNKEKEAA